MHHFVTEMCAAAHFCYKMVHCGICDQCIVRFVHNFVSEMGPWSLIKLWYIKAATWSKFMYIRAYVVLSRMNDCHLITVTIINPLEHHSVYRDKITHLLKQHGFQNHWNTIELLNIDLILNTQKCSLSEIWENFHHMMQQKLAKWSIPVQQLTIFFIKTTISEAAISSKWWHSLFSSKWHVSRA